MKLRVLPVTGAILAALGLLLIIKPVSYSHEVRVFKLGDIEAKVQDERTIPGWVGGILLGAGGVLFILGLKKSL